MMAVSLSLTPNTTRTASRIRAPFAELVVDFFRAPELEIKAAGYQFISQQPNLIKQAELDEWNRRPSGVLVVGSSKSLLSRLIKGDSIKNQASGAIRTAAGNLSNLNLTQLITLRHNCDAAELQKSAIPELRDFGNCLEEAFNERLAARVLEASSVFSVKDESRNCEVESFSNAERKFLGRRLLLNFGAIAYQRHSFPFPIENSNWFIFCGSKAPASPAEVRGFFFSWPDVQISLTRPAGALYSLADLRDSDTSPGTGGASWHILVCHEHLGIDELVRSSMSCRSLVASPQTKTSQRVMRHLDTTPSTDLSPEPDTLSLERDTPPRHNHTPKRHTDIENVECDTAEGVETENVDTGDTLSPVQEEILPVTRKNEETQGHRVPTFPDEAPEVETDKVEEEQGEEGGGEQGGEVGGEENQEGGEVGGEDGEEYVEWEYTGPVEYDEAVPTYYDMYQEQYFYYGNILYFDPDWSAYYYYDWEQETYLYIDEETQKMINEGTIPIWSEEDGQYYEASEWAAAEEEEGGDDSEPPAQDDPQAVPEPETEIEAEAEAEETIKEDKLEEVLREIEKEETAAAKQVKTAGEEKIGVAEETIETETTEVATTPTEMTTTPTGTDLTTVEMPVVDVEVEVPVVEDVESSKSNVTLERKDSLLLERAQGSLQRVTVKSQVAAPPKNPERFTGSIDQFQSSEARLIQRALSEVICLFSKTLLDSYDRRPNGTLRVGRNKRTFDGLIRGSLELKSLAASDCADAASSLPLLNLAQLIHIRRNAQNSAWNKSPLSTLKTFAMKTDSLIAEKFAVYLVTKGLYPDADSVADELPKLAAPEWRHAGAQAIFVIGAMSELRHAKVKVQGADFVEGRTSLPQASWWFLNCSPTGTAAVPRGKVEGLPKGMFFKYPDLQATFDRPKDVHTVFKLVAGRQQAGFLTWDVLEITL